MTDMSSSTGVLTQDLQNMAAFLTDVFSKTFSTQNYQKAIKKKRRESLVFALEELQGEQLSPWSRMKIQ